MGSPARAGLDALPAMRAGKVVILGGSAQSQTRTSGAVPAPVAS